eukprot:Hpha_TRINITY_DN15350_c2_g1::TRINITY_DN15350_c2_g1_i1::g.88821::m.88821
MAPSSRERDSHSPTCSESTPAAPLTGTAILCSASSAAASHCASHPSTVSLRTTCATCRKRLLSCSAAIRHDLFTRCAAKSAPSGMAGQMYSRRMSSGKDTLRRVGHGVGPAGTATGGFLSALLLRRAAELRGGMTGAVGLLGRGGRVSRPQPPASSSGSPAAASCEAASERGTTLSTAASFDSLSAVAQDPLPDSVGVGSLLRRWASITASLFAPESGTAVVLDRNRATAPTVPRLPGVAGRGSRVPTVPRVAVAGAGRGAGSSDFGASTPSSRGGLLGAGAAGGGCEGGCTGGCTERERSTSTRRALLLRRTAAI